MAGADGAAEGTPDATYAALEGPRTFTSAPEVRSSVLSHSKSHPRMLESACSILALFLPYDELVRLEHLTHRAPNPSHSITGNATSHVWPLGALAELLDKYVPALSLDSSRSPFRGARFRFSKARPRCRLCLFRQSVFFAHRRASPRFAV
jgi:hypothetical protein